MLTARESHEVTLWQQTVVLGVSLDGGLCRPEINWWDTLGGRWSIRAGNAQHEGGEGYGRRLDAGLDRWQSHGAVLTEVEHQRLRGGVQRMLVGLTDSDRPWFCLLRWVEQATEDGGVATSCSLRYCEDVVPREYARRNERK